MITTEALTRARAREEAPAALLTNGIAADQLKAIIERIERLEEEIKAINEDKKDIYSEAKANGFDTKIIKKVIAMRRLDHSQRMEQEAILDLYLEALGMA